MVLRCIHGLPRTNCVYCSKLNDILNQDTMSYRKLMRLVTAVSDRSIVNTITRLSQQQEYPRIPIPITDRMRQTARNLINAPGNRATRERFENAAMNQVIRVEFGEEGDYSGGNTRSLSASAVSVYSRLGTPSVRRARSTTPMSTLRPASPGSNNNNSNRFSPPRVKRPRKSG